MAYRALYLAKYRGSPSQRAHFALFVPNPADSNKDLTQDFRSSSCKGTAIHVVGEPVMNGYMLEFKRNYECSSSRDLYEMVLLGYVDSGSLYAPSYTKFTKESHPRGLLESEAAMVAPPPRGQNIRAPIDGINTKRCQEWTMEYLSRIESRGLISSGAVSIAESHRDPPTHGIFGQRNARQPAGAARADVAQPHASAANIEWVWDEDHQRYRYWDGSQWQWQQ